MRRKKQLVGVVGCGPSGSSGIGTVLNCLYSCWQSHPHHLLPQL